MKYTNKCNENNTFMYADCHYNADGSVFRKKDNCQKKSQCTVIKLMTKHC